MPVNWAGTGPDLLVPLDRTAATPLRFQLEDGLRQSIRTGRLPAGERLPSSRELARQLGVSRGLVQDCYGQLLAEGYLTAQVGSGTRVAAVSASASVVPPLVPVPPRLIADFAPGVPDLGRFPRNDWAWAVREACRTVPTAALSYGDPRGPASVREVLAGYLRRVRAADASPDRLVVSAGFAQGVSLVSRALAATGVRRMGFEDPGYGDGETRAAVVRAGLTPVPVPVDADGVDVAALRAADVGAVLLTPAHQWPTGVVLSPARRHALVEWASSSAAVILEDDYDAEFRYDREPVGALQGLAPDRVVVLGTVSKALAPAVRLGWVLAPGWLAPAVAAEKRLADRGSPVLDQLALAALVESGRYDRHLRRLRGVYAARREVLVSALATLAPGVSVSGLAAGFHAVASLPSGVSEPSVLAAARSRGVGLYGMSACRSSGAVAPPQLILGFGNVGERAVRAGVEAVADLLSG